MNRIVVISFEGERTNAVKSSTLRHSPRQTIVFLMGFQWMVDPSYANEATASNDSDLEVLQV